MMTTSSPSVGLKWVVGPVVLAALTGVAGHYLSLRPHGPFAAAVDRSSAVARKALAAAPALAVANATWALGDVDAIKTMARFEMDRIGDSNGSQLARVLLRFGLVDTNPDGQAAVFNQACVADASYCAHLKEAAERETKARLVSPGDRLPLYFLTGHPHEASPQ